jgi:hypothetical protein
LPVGVKNVSGLYQSASLGRIGGVDTIAGTVPITASVLYTGLPPGQSLNFYYVNDNSAATVIPANTCSATGNIAGSITYLV